MRIIVWFFCLLILTACAASPERTRPGLSGSGCGLVPDRDFSTIQLLGRTRKFILVLPDNYQPDYAHPVVFAFHGRTNSNAKVRGYYDLERHAVKPTIFVYPSGLSQNKRWSNPRDKADSLRDYAFFDALLTLLQQRYCIDTKKVYLVGHSLGGWFVNSLACARGHKIRAVAALGGGFSTSDCRGQFAALLIHNPKDRLSPIKGSVRARDHFLKLNQITAQPKTLTGHPLNCRRFGAKTAAHPVIWCPHRRDHTWRGKYYPHNWPRGTGKIIMSFFETLP